jgi:hypothetical protein
MGRIRGAMGVLFLDILPSMTEYIHVNGRIGQRPKTIEREGETILMKQY